MKKFIIPCLIACSLFTLVGCADDTRSTSTTTSASMSTDSKDMQTHH